MENVKLGQKVRVKAVVVSEVHYPPNTFKARRVVRHKEQHGGYIAGVRTLKEGITHDGYEYGFSFKPTNHIRVYLVAVSLSRMVRALPEDVEVIGSDDMGLPF